MLTGGARPLHAHRARRPHRRRANGGLVITDYKTGGNIKDLGGRASAGRGAAAAAGGGDRRSPAASPACPRAHVARAALHLELRRRAAGPGVRPQDRRRGSTRAQRTRRAGAPDRRVRREATPYRALRRARFTYRYDDYAHLARVAEWSAETDEEVLSAMDLFGWAKSRGQPRDDTRLAETRRNQAAAADPTSSAWVSANAGTGKTHVLTMRVLRLLLAGTPPERILALTYTKAAAAEMSKRVFARLAEWVTARRRGAQGEARRAARTGRRRRPRCSARASCSPSPSRRRAGSRCRPSTPSASGCCSAFRWRPACRRALPSSTTTSARQLLSEAADEVLAEATARADTPLAGALETAVGLRHRQQFRSAARRGAARAGLAGGGGAARRRRRRRPSPGPRRSTARRSASRPTCAARMSRQRMAALLSEAELRAAAGHPGVGLGQRRQGGRACRRRAARAAARRPHRGAARACSSPPAASRARA